MTFSLPVTDLGINISVLSDIVGDFGVLRGYTAVRLLAADAVPGSKTIYRVELGFDDPRARGWSALSKLF